MLKNLKRGIHQIMVVQFQTGLIMPASSDFCHLVITLANSLDQTVV